MCSESPITIPCEYCAVEVELDDYAWHSKQCADRERDRFDEARSTTNEFDGEMIPCEYCSTQVNVHEYEWHSKQCADKDKSRMEEQTRRIANESANALVPCEYCQRPVSIQHIETHETECRRILNSTVASLLLNFGFSQQIIDDGNPLSQCPVCYSQNLLTDIIRLQCGCTTCCVCFATTLHELQQIKQILLCPQCTSPVQETDIDKVKVLPANEIQSIKEFQRNKLFENEQWTTNGESSGAPINQLSATAFAFPSYWDLSLPNNFSRHTLDPQSSEYKFVEKNFRKSMPLNVISQIERIQNRRWYRQYDAHRADFVERYGHSTEEWLFHGCAAQGANAIVNDCFNRSYTVRCAVGQGIYFARDAATSHNYSVPDATNVKRMFMARVLIGKTTIGSSATRVCPPGFDTTGGGSVFVTYHDSQAYGEYLITFT